jgi:hypothetical protein
MSKILNTAAAVIISSVGFAAMGSVPALATSYYPDYHAHAAKRIQRPNEGRPTK